MENHWNLPVVKIIAYISHFGKSLRVLFCTWKILEKNMDFFPTFGKNKKKTGNHENLRKKPWEIFPKSQKIRKSWDFLPPWYPPKGAPDSSPSAAAVSSDPPGPGDPPAGDMTMNSLELFVHLISWYFMYLYIYSTVYWLICYMIKSDCSI